MKKFSKLHMQNEDVHVISPIIILLVALLSLSSRQRLSWYLSMFVKLLFYYLYITGSKNTCSLIAGDY